MTFLDRLISPKCDFTQNRSGGKIIKFQQSQALTSHFEIIWSIVRTYEGDLGIHLGEEILDKYVVGLYKYFMW